jgi:hypothetical protein
MASRSAPLCRAGFGRGIAENIPPTLFKFESKRWKPSKVVTRRRRLASGLETASLSFRFTTSDFPIKGDVKLRFENDFEAIGEIGEV